MPPPSRAYAVSDGWTETGTAEWQLSDDGVLTIRPVDNGESGTIGDKSWDSASVTKIVLEGSLNLVSDTSRGGIFSSYPYLTEIDGLANLDTSNYAYSGLFMSNPFLREIDVSCLDFSSLLSMKGMFSGDKSLTSVTFGNMDASKVSTMTEMFAGCSALKTVDMSGVKPENLTDVSTMFYGCSSLQSLDLSSLKTSNARNMASMFYGRSALESLDVSGFDTSSVLDMSNMFSVCRSLKDLDLSSFDTSKTVTMSGMFSNCSKLINVILPDSFIGNSVTDVSKIFSFCGSLKTVPANFSFGSNSESLKKDDAFDSGSSSTLTGTYYFGSDETVLSYDWTADYRILLTDEKQLVVGDYKRTYKDLPQSEWKVPIAVDCGYSADEAENLIFAGWYADAEYTTPYMATSGAAYPKFVKKGDELGIVFNGGSLRMDDNMLADGTFSYLKTSLRFGYDVRFPSDCSLSSWGWDWTTSPSGKTTHTDGVSETDTSTGAITNLVFTNVKQAHFADSLYVTFSAVVQTADGTLVPLSDSQQSRSASQVAGFIIAEEPSSSASYQYANGLLGAASANVA